MDESEKKPDPAPVEKGTSDKDQKNIRRTDPGLKSGYKKNPSQPQGSFISDSQIEKPADSQAENPADSQTSKASDSHTDEPSELQTDKASAGKKGDES